jgi:hypothetical protein
MAGVPDQDSSVAVSATTEDGGYAKVFALRFLQLRLCALHDLPPILALKRAKTFRTGNRDLADVKRLDAMP